MGNFEQIDENELDWKPDLSHPLLVNNKKCILLVGPPGSGKSTYAARLMQRESNYALICPDSIRAEFGDITDQSRNAMIFNSIVPARMVGANAQGRNIIIDATSVTRDRRKNLIAQAKSMQYSVEAHVLNTPIEVCKARNMQRERNVPEIIIDRMFRQFKYPSLDEGIDAIIEVKS